MTRALRPLHPLRARRAPGARLSAAHGAQRLRAGLGTGLQRRLGVGEVLADPGATPWGLWPTAGGETTAQQLPNRALERYAETLRRKRGVGRPLPQRGLPLVARRGGGTAVGPRTGPGGLAQGLVPVDRPERADIAAILRDGRRPTASAVPLPRSRPDRGGR